MLAATVQRYIRVRYSDFSGHSRLVKFTNTSLYEDIEKDVHPRTQYSPITAASSPTALPPRARARSPAGGTCSTDGASNSISSTALLRHAIRRPMACSNGSMAVSATSSIRLGSVQEPSLNRRCATTSRYTSTTSHSGHPSTIRRFSHSNNGRPSALNCSLNASIIKRS